MKTNNLDYFKQKIYEISGVPKSRLRKELFGEEPSKEFNICIGKFRVRLLYDPCILIDGWKKISFHHFSFTLNRILSFHMAVRKKWPFIKIGFNNIYPKLYKEGGF